MKKVRYIGRHNAVEVALPEGGEAVVEHGKVLETSAEHALSLCEQDENWEPVGWKLPKPEPEAAADTDSDQPGEPGEKEA